MVAESRQTVSSIAFALFTDLSCTPLHRSSSGIPRHLSLPNPLHALGQANVVRLELVPPPSDQDERCPACPLRKRPNLWDAPAREVVGDAIPVSETCQHTCCRIRAHADCIIRITKLCARPWKVCNVLKANVRMDQDQTNEDAVKHRVQRSSREGRNGDR